MANWSLPSLSDLYSNFLTYLKGRDDDAARLNDSRASSASNLPDYAKRWNDTTKTFQNWLSSTWSSIVLAIAGGGTGAATAAGARTNLDVYSKAEADAAFGVNLTHLMGSLSSAVYLVNTGVEYEGPSVSLTPGKWVVHGMLNLRLDSSKSATLATVKLKIGTDIWDLILQSMGAVDQGMLYARIPLMAIFTIGTTSIVKITASSAFSGTNGGYMDTYSFILAFKIGPSS